MSDPAERIRRVRILFDAVVDLSAPARHAKLHELAGGDLALEREVEELIGHLEDTASHLASPFAGMDRQDADSLSIVGQRLGPYNVVRLVGMGGMGAVYEAVRADDQYQKRVAIKIVQRGLDAELTLARFRRERQILANLEHPNIARLLDGGVTPDGRPFLVMEYIDGQPITTWCDEKTLSVRGRVALFRQVCAAVQYAHTNLVVHRDLKPGNILVTADGTVKLLDFGIAKLLSEDVSDTAMPLTRGGARAFTAEYASPEQIRGDVLSTASDLYSLGVVLFELLAGRRPHLSSGHASGDIERAVLTEATPRPSSVITADAARHASERDDDRLQRRLLGELDNIVLTALRPEPLRRYPSVGAFDDDLRRYLGGLPVQAQRDWAGYRLRKFVRRNAAAVTASALVIVAIIAGSIATTLQARRAQREQLKEAQVNGFLMDLLNSVQPDVGHRDVQVSEVLDSAAQRLEHQLSTQPDVRAELEGVIGQSYAGLGRYEEAELHLKRGLELHRLGAGLRTAAAVVQLSNLGQLYMSKGALDSAEMTFKQALANWQTHANHPDSLYASLLSGLGSLAHNQGHAAEAERFHRQAMDIQRRVLGDHDDLVGISLNDIAVAVGEQGRMADAESLHRAALGILRKNHPEPNVKVAGVLNALATILDLEGKNASADSAYIETLAIRKTLLGADHPDYTFTLFNYSMFIFDQKRYQEAADYSRQILALRGKSLPESHPSIAAALQTLGRSLDHLGDTQSGERALMESLELRRKYNGAESWLAASSEGVLGEHYTFLRQYPKAEQVLLQAQALFVKLLGEENPRTQTNIKRLVALYEAWGKPEQAAAYRGKLSKPK